MASSDKATSAGFKWQLVAADEKPDLKAKYLILPLAIWLTDKTAYKNRDDIAIWLDSSEAPEQLADDLAHFAFNFAY